MALSSIRQIKKAHEEAGLFFFDKATMRGFKSRVMSQVFPVPNGAVFVTSERFEDFQGNTKPRRYTIRRAYDNGEIRTVEGFQSYASRTGALDGARRHALKLKGAYEITSK
jgi:hypothetical protein